MRQTQALFRKRPKIKTRIRKPNRIIRNNPSVQNAGDDKVSFMNRQRSYRKQNRNRKGRRNNGN